MRLSVLTAVVLVPLATARAQSPSALVRPQGQAAQGTAAQSLGPTNPWGLSGAMSIKPLAGGGKFSEEWLLGSSRVAFEIPDGTGALGRNSHIAVFANLADVASRIGSGADSLDGALQTLISSDEGLNVGIYPYWTLPNMGKFRPVLFTSAGAKLNSYKTGDSTDTKTSLLVGRFAAGLELILGAGDSPLTLSFSGVHSRFGAAAYEAVFKESRSSITSVELTSIVPLGAKGTGLIFEAIGASRAKPSFRLGLLFKVPGKGGAAAEGSGNAGADCADGACALTVTGATTGAPIAVTVTAPANAQKSASCSALVNDATCTISVAKGTTLGISVPAGVTLSGSGCSGSACTITMDKAASVTARRN